MNAFDVVAEPTRRQILDLVRDRDRSVNELVDMLSMSQPAVSKHLRVLREGGFVSSRVDGQRRLYHLEPQAFEEVESWLEPYRRFWEERLEALGRHLEEMASKEQEQKA